MAPLQVLAMSEVPLTPVGREGIRKLEAALLVGALFRPEVMEALRDPTERLTWIDSLAAAAAALARQKAGLSVRQIADEVGLSEAAIRRHLDGKTRAGELVRKVYEQFAREGVKVELPIEVERVRELEDELSKLRSAVAKAVEALDEAVKVLKEALGSQ